MLTKLKIRNFKRFGSVEVELWNPVVFIVPLYKVDPEIKEKLDAIVEADGLTKSMSQKDLRAPW